MSSPDRLSYWYLRLNGFLTIENFVVHPDAGPNQRTDADLLGVRFGHRSENLLQPMEDDKTVTAVKAYANIIIAEVKKGQCALNGPWKEANDQNINRVLSAIGCIGATELKAASQELYGQGSYVGNCCTVRLMAFGDRHGQLQIPVQQVLFDDMLEFIYGRFWEYRRQKASNGNWPQDGVRLWEAFEQGRSDKDGFRSRARKEFGL